MIKGRVRKEICLLLILAVIISQISSQTVYASVAKTAVNNQELTNMVIHDDIPFISAYKDPIASDSMLSAPSSDPSVSKDPFAGSVSQPTKNDASTVSDAIEPIADEPTVNQTAQSVLFNEQPALNTYELHLIADGASYELHVANAVHASYSLSAGAPSIAVLSNETAQSVTITPKVSGQTILLVTAVAHDGTQRLLSCQITVTELSLSKESVDLYMNDPDPSTDITLNGIDLDTVYYESGNSWKDESIQDALNNNMNCTIQIGNPNVADAWFSDASIHIKGLKKGITNIKLKIYGTSLSIRVHVHHYTLNKYTINTYKGSSIKSLKLKGTDGHKITWVSGNKNVASVSKTGIVSIKGIGTTKITAKVNGRKVVCIVSVSSKTAYQVVKDARAILKKKNIQYSQALRMSKNYYDCSSLVYRCYKPYGIRFGCTDPSWAPTASEEGRWCVVTGRQIATQAIDLLSCKLIPGDTIYYSFNGENERYLDIDHTAIFAGYAYNASIGYYGTVIEASSFSNTIVERMYDASDRIKLIGRPSRA